MRYRSYKTAQPGLHNDEEIDDPKLSSVVTIENESFALRKDLSTIQPTIRIEDYIQEDSKDQYSDNSENRDDLQNDRVEFESFKSDSNHGLNKSGIQKQTIQLFSGQTLNNEPIPITSIQQLLEIIGVSLTDNYFALNGQIYELKLDQSNFSPTENMRFIKNFNVLSPSQSQPILEEQQDFQEGLLLIPNGYEAARVVLNYQDQVMQLQNSDESIYEDAKDQMSKNQTFQHEDEEEDKEEIVRDILGKDGVNYQESLQKQRILNSLDQSYKQSQSQTIQSRITSKRSSYRDINIPFSQIQEEELKYQFEVRHSVDIIHKRDLNQKNEKSNRYPPESRREIEELEKFSSNKAQTPNYDPQITDEYADTPHSIDSKLRGKRISTKNIIDIESNHNSGRRSAYRQRLTSVDQAIMERFSNNLTPTGNNQNRDLENNKDVVEKDELKSQNNNFTDAIHNQDFESPNLHSSREEEFKDAISSKINNFNQDDSYSNEQTTLKMRRQTFTQDIDDDQVLLLENSDMLRIKNQNEFDANIRKKKSTSDFNLLNTINDHEDNYLLDGVNLLKDSAQHSPFILKDAIDPALEGRENPRSLINNEIYSKLQQNYQSKEKDNNNPFQRNNSQSSEYNTQNLSQQIQELSEKIQIQSMRISEGKDIFIDKSQQFKNSQLVRCNIDLDLDEQGSPENYMTRRISQRTEKSPLQNYITNYKRSRDSSKSVGSKSNQTQKDKLKTNKNLSNKSQDSIDKKSKQSSKSQGLSLKQNFPIKSDSSMQNLNKQKPQINLAQADKQQQQQEEVFYQIDLSQHNNLEKNDSNEEIKLSLEKEKEEIQVQEIEEEEEFQNFRKFHSEVAGLSRFQGSQRRLNNDLIIKIEQDLTPATVGYPVQTPLFQELQEMKYESNQYKNLHNDFMISSPPKDNLPMFDFGQSETINIAFMFASPIFFKEEHLNYQISNNIDPQTHFQTLQDSLQQTQNNLKIGYNQASINNLYHIMTQNPQGIHFIGSAHRPNKYEDDYYLVLENESGEAEFVQPNTLGEILGSGDQALDFVFAVTKSDDIHSLASVFNQAKIKHVICAKTDSDSAEDDALQTFILTFYGSLFKLDITICEAYESSLSKVIQLFGQERGFDFMLLKEEMQNGPNLIETFDLKKLEEIHTCKQLGPFQKGPLEIVDEPFFQQSMPQQSQNFDLKNQKEATEVISEIILNRLVILLGHSGTGKSSLLQNILHFLSPRNFFASGIVYLNLRGLQEISSFLKQLTLTLICELPYFQSEKMQESVLMNTEQIYKVSLNYLRNITQPLLFVFDNSEGIQFHEQQKFENIIEEIMTQNPFIKVILTTQMALGSGSLTHISKSIHIMRNLTQNETLSYLLSSLNRQVSQQEIDQLFALQSQYQIESQRYQDHTLQNHDLIQLLASNQQALLISSHLLQSLSLSELYYQIVSPNSLQQLSQDKIESLSLAVLRLVTNIALKQIQKEQENHPQTLQFFYLLGLLKIPTTEKFVRKIWGIDYEKHIEVLQQNGLISLSWHEEHKIVMSSFVGEISRSQINLKDMALLINDISRYLNNQCDKVYRANCKYRKNQEKARLKCKEIKLKHLSFEAIVQECLQALIQDYQIGQNVETESNQIQKIQISKIYEPKLSKTPSQPQLKKIESLRNQNSSQLKIAKPSKTRSSFNSLQKQNNNSSIHSKKPSWLLQNTTNNSSSSFLKGKNINTPLRRSQNSSRNKAITKQNTSQDNQIDSLMIQQQIDGTSSPKIYDEEISLEFLTNMHYANLQKDKDSQMWLITKHSVSFKIDKIAINIPQNQNLLDLLKDPTKVDDFTLTEERIKILNSVQNSPKNSVRSTYQNYSLTSSIKRQKSQKLNQSPNPYSDSFTSSSQAKDEQMHEIEKMTLKFMMNLFLFREIEQLDQFIEKYALNINGCKLFTANLHRIKGLIFQSQHNTQKCIEYLKKAKELYKYKDSFYGQALSRYSIALFQKKLLVQQNVDFNSNLDTGYQKLIEKFEKALNGFKQVNHLIGQALCHNQLSLIYKSRFSEQNTLIDIEKSKEEFTDHQNEQMRIMAEYQEYTQKKKCPHIKRVQGPEFSLMLELVLDISNSNLFPPCPPINQKYELQAIQEDDMEESMMFSEENNIKEAMRDQQEVLMSASYLEIQQQEQSTPKSRVSKVTHQEISKLYGVEDQGFSSQYQNVNQAKKNAFQNPFEMLIISGQRTLEQNTNNSSKQQQKKIQSQPYYFQENQQQNNFQENQNKHPPQIVSPDNYINLSDRKPKQMNHDLAFPSPFMSEEDSRVYTCSPQESSINQINQTEEIQSSQQAYFSQNSRRSMRIQSQLEVVDEENEQIYFEFGDKNSPQNPRFSHRSLTKLQTSLDMSDKNKSLGSIVSVSLPASQFIPQQKYKTSSTISDQKQSKKSKLITPKHNAQKSKVIQINLKQLK